MIWQFIINGLITGILYSLLAIGLALVYDTTRFFHIVAAGIYVFAPYMFWFFMVRVGLPIISAYIGTIMVIINIIAVRTELVFF